MNFYLPWLRATFVAFIVAAMAHLAMALEERGFVFDIHGDQVTITGYSGSGRDIKIPSELNGKAVVEIGSAAFSSSTTIRSVAIPSSVTSIGDRAFYGCTSLTRASFLGNAPAMGIDVFSGVGSGFKVYYSFYSDQTGFTTPTWSGYEVENLNPFKKRKVMGGVSIASYPKTAVGALIIPDTLDGKNVVAIEENVFYDSDGLTSVTIPSNVTRIGDRAFAECGGLKTLTIYSRAATYGLYAFRSCPNLTSVTIRGNVTGMESDVFNECRNLTSVTFLGNVASIGDSAFNGCGRLKSVTFNGSLGIIGSSAFYGCRNLTGLILPSRVNSIGSSAFSGCASLRTVLIPPSVRRIESSTFFECGSLVNVTIPSSVTSIGAYAFADCRNLSGLTIPSSVTSIGNSAFYNCRKLTSVEIPSSVTIMESELFLGCRALRSVKILGNITSIGSNTFADCTSLTSVTIPASVTSIGSSAFFGCRRLKNVTFLGKAPLLGDENSFYEVGSGFTLTRQSGAKGFDVPPWNFFKITTAPPLPWQSVEIGDGGLGGFDSFTDGTFTVNGAGKAGKASDRFRFVYQILSGDGEIVAKVDKHQDSGSSSRVGVTIRNSLAPSAPYVFIGLGGDGACRWDQRKTSGINYDSNRSSGSAPDTWLRLVRNGSVVHAYKSGDGRTWAKVGSAKTTLAKNCHIGLVVSSGSETLLNSAKFRNVEVKP